MVLILLFASPGGHLTLIAQSECTPVAAAAAGTAAVSTALMKMPTTSGSPQTCWIGTAISQAPQ